MAGLFTIQRVPKALLDFLGLKGSGQTPTDLESQLRSVVNCTPFYLADRAAGIITNTGNFAADGTQAFATSVATVPAGEAWIPICCSMQRDTAGLTAGNTFTFGTQVKLAQFPTVTLPGQGNVVTPTGGRVGFAWPQWTLMLPGDAFSAWTVGGTYAGTNALVFNLAMYRLFI